MSVCPIQFMRFPIEQSQVNKAKLHPQMRIIMVVVEYK